jgi:hypothetical protein
VPTPEATPSPAGVPKVQVTGFVDIYYGYNFNGVDPSLRTFDVQHNAFSLSLAEVARAGPGPEPPGVRADPISQDGRDRGLLRAEDA